MSTTPAGLRRFQRAMISKYPGKCAFCATPTLADRDWYVFPNKLAVCLACADSLVAQVRGMVRAIDTAASAANLTPEQVTMLQASLPANLADAMTDGATDAAAYDAVVKLQAAFATIKSFASAAVLADETSIGHKLQAIADNANAAPRDREFARSLASWVAGGRDLTPNQAPHADRLIARYATGSAPVAAAPATQAGIGLYAFDNGDVRKVYLTQNERIACKLLTVMGDHGSFQYEKGGTRTVSEAVANGTAHLMTEVEAAAFGRLHSFCCNCCRDLDDDRSLAAGYGPVCAENNHWHYPTYEQAAAILGRPVTTPAGKVIEPPAA